MEANNVSQRKITQFNVSDIIQVIFGQVSPKSDTLLTFLIDGQSIGLKKVMEAKEQFFFENRDICIDLIDQIKIQLNKKICFSPKSDKQKVFEYHRRDKIMFLI